MAPIAGLALRSVQFLFTLILIGLIGHVIAMQDISGPASVNYTLFAAAFSLLSLLYLIPATWKDSLAGHPLIMVAVDLLNVIFTLTAGIALAARLGVHSCSNESYLADNEVTNRSFFHREERCREAQASTAFLWFLFAAYLGSLVLSILKSRSGANLRSQPAQSRPGMSQV